MTPTASTSALGRRMLSSTAAARARPQRRTPGSGAGRDGMDIAQMSSQQFDFPLTRPTLLKMDKRRDFLHYLRLEQLQFRDLVAFRQRFYKPTATQVIKVRHQHYQGEPHPASRKVSITFKASALPPLETEAQQHKFKLLCGPRWNALTDEVKISCELFPTPEMNEKWCSDALDRLIKEAQDSTDAMTDIPLDTRPALAKLRKSHSKRATPVTLAADFPKEWLPSTAPTPAEGGGVKTEERKVDRLPSAGVGRQGGAGTDESARGW